MGVPRFVKQATSSASCEDEIASSRDELGRFKKGHTPWNKGKHRTEEVKAKMRGPRPNFKGNQTSFKKGQHASPQTEFKKGHKPWNKGKHHSKEARRKMSEASKGCVPWNKGKNIRLGPEKLPMKTLLKMSEARKRAWKEGKYSSPQYRQKLSEAQKRRLSEPGELKKVLSSRRPTSLEKMLMKIIQRNNLPYKYVGDGSFTIGHFNPDFVNCDGQKIAVDVFGDYWHKMRGTDEEERKRIFADFGWELIVIWEHELDDLSEEDVVSRLTE